MSIISACIGLVLFVYIMIRDARLKKRGRNPNEYFHLRGIENKMEYKGNIFYVNLSNKRVGELESDAKKRIAKEKVNSAKANSSQNDSKANKKSLKK